MNAVWVWGGYQGLWDSGHGWGHTPSSICAHQHSRNQLERRMVVWEALYISIKMLVFNWDLLDGGNLCAGLRFV